MPASLERQPHQNSPDNHGRGRSAKISEVSNSIEDIEKDVCGGNLTTPPPAARHVRLRGNKLTWEAEADLESGLASFIIERDGRFVAHVPEKSHNPFGRPIFQGLQYSDTPTQPLVPMQFTDAKAAPGKRHSYRVIAVNTVGLRSRLWLDLLKRVLS